MNILHTVEFYSPSVGGAQEVVKQLSERLVQRGHQVTVATTRLPERTATEINGVNIVEFNIHGNAVRGMTGEIERYQQFLLNGKFDIMMSYAAQEWTVDLSFPILTQIPYKKILIPCGFSGLHLPEYAEYFRQLPDILRHYDQLVFHADNYRDTNFARQHNLQPWSIIPNGASQAEFSVVDTTFRQRYGIAEDETLLLTVGSHTGLKGHRLSIETLLRLTTKPVTLIIIGNVFGKGHWWRNFAHPMVAALKRRQVRRAAEILSDTLWGGIGPAGCLSNCRAHARQANLSGSKKVLLLDLPRAEVVAAYHAADLFLLGSNIEYSPIVLYEALASQTPFISLACGNAAEIAAWSGGGLIAPTRQKEHGFVDGDPTTFAHLVDELLENAALRQTLGENGQTAWLEHFTWEQIAANYEVLYQSLLDK